NHLSRRGVGFDHDAGTRSSPQSRESKKAGHSLCVQRDTFWPAVHETLTVVAQNQVVLPEGKPAQHDQGHAPRATCLRHVEEAVVPKSGPGIGSSDRCIPHWMGGSHEWPLRPSWHINCLEMLAVFRALRYFLPDLRDRHVLVRTDSTAVVYYINHQGGLRSRPLYKLAHQILVWSQDKLLSLRAVHIPGHLNVGADARGMDDMGDLWSSPSGSLCYEGECAISSSSPGAGCHSTDVAEATSVRLSSDRSAPRSSGESLPGRGQCTISSPVLAGPSMVLGPDISPRRLSMGDSRGGHHPSPPPRAVEAVGVASEGAQFIASGLSTEVVETIL
ncbi:hypothetical protein M9458_039627, partial [Cirrhinus mrigala]